MTNRLWRRARRSRGLGWTGFTRSWLGASTRSPSTSGWAEARITCGRRICPRNTFESTASTRRRRALRDGRPPGGRHAGPTRTISSFGPRRSGDEEARGPRVAPLGIGGQPKEDGTHGDADDEGTPGGRCAFRPPDQALEPEDAEVHLRGAQRHLHHRPAENAEEVPRGLRLRARPR